MLLAAKLYNTVDCGNLYCGAYNFGPNDDGFVTVEEIVKMISWYFGEMPYDVISSEGHIRHEAQILIKVDSKKKLATSNQRHNICNKKTRKARIS